MRFIFTSFQLNIRQTIEVFKSSLYRSPEDDNNLRGEMVLSFYDRKEVKEYFGFVTRHEQIYFERWYFDIICMLVFLI